MFPLCLQSTTTEFYPFYIEFLRNLQYHLQKLPTIFNPNLDQIYTLTSSQQPQLRARGVQSLPEKYFGHNYLAPR